LLEPADALKTAEESGDFTQRLSLLESLKSMPFGAVWDMFCLKQGVPIGADFMSAIRDYEERELSRRS